MQVAGLPTGVVMAATEVDVKTAGLIRPPLRSAPLGRILRAATLGHSAPMGYLRSAPVGYSAACLRASYHRSFCFAPHHRLVRASTGPSFFGFTRPARASEGVSKIRNWKCSSTPVDNTGNEPKPEAPTKWAEVLAFLIKVKGNLFLLLLLGVSLWIGFLAVKERPMANDIVNVCDKAHKIYNIASKGFLIIAEMWKGDSK